MDEGVMFNINTCRFVVWGYKNTYHTHTHIHEAFYRTLLRMGKQVKWMDSADDIRRDDFSNTLFITNHDCVTNNYWPWDKPCISKLPKFDDCFYVIHGLNDNPEARGMFSNHGNKLSWNVYHDYSSTLGMPVRDYPRPKVGVPLTESILLDTDTPFYIKQKHMDFRWATDLMPDEIEANKPRRMLSLNEKNIYWVGTVWWVNQKELLEFRRACEEDGINFNHLGAGQNGIINIDENIKLVRRSWMAPAISGSHHLTEGYVPCRIFKNISYGQFGITNSKRVNDIFGGKLIFNPDPYKLYYEAKERLQHIDVKELHSLMDEVASKHTYVNRINSVMQAVRLITEG